MRSRNYRVKEGFLKGRAQSRLQSLWYYQHIVKVYPRRWYINAANIFILPNGVGQDLRAKNKEIGGERASLSHSTTQRKELRRPTIVLDTTAYIRVK